jgi:hypothetical protein
MLYSYRPLDINFTSCRLGFNPSEVLLRLCDGQSDRVRFYSENFCFPLQNIIPLISHTHLPVPEVERPNQLVCFHNLRSLLELQL